MADANPWYAQILGTLLGGAMTFLGGVYAHWTASAREREARQHESQKERDRQWSDFQVKNLMDLQDSLDDLIRTAFDASIAMEKYWKKRMSEGDTEKAAESYVAARTRVRVLSSRIQDEKTRSLTDEFERVVARIKGYQNQNASQETVAAELGSIMDEANSKFIEVCNRTGELIRKSHRSA